MHVNHRRKNKHRSSHHNDVYCFRSDAVKGYQKISWRRRRARERDLIAVGRYDLLPSKYKSDIRYHLW